VKLLQGDLAEAWREGGDEYATVAMRYQQVDKTLDRATGKVLEGDDKPDEGKKKKHDEFDCPSCNANNPWPDGLHEGEEIHCHYCGTSFLVRFTGGSHTGFSDENPETEPDPRQAQHDVTKRYATPFLLKYLAHKNKFGRRLRANDDGVAALVARPN